MRSACVALMLASAVAPAEAQVRVGLFAGDPIAVTLRVDMGAGWAIESALGYSPSPDRTALVMLGLSRDLMAPLLHVADGAIVPVLGLGLRLGLDRTETSRESSEVRAGVRVPLALAWRRGGVELYAEAAPGAEFGQRVRMSIEGGIGVRIPLGE